MNGDDKFLGIVQGGQFTSLVPPGAMAKLTGISMQAAQSPESEAVDLTAYEGLAIMVQGHNGGGWIYSASVIDQAGPILTAVVNKLFRSETGGDKAAE